MMIKFARKQNPMTSPCTTAVNRVQRFWHLQIPLLIIVISLSLSVGVVKAENEQRIITNIGAIISGKSRTGKEQRRAMNIAAAKFNSRSKTHELHLCFRDSDRDPLIAASAAEELIKDMKVRVLIGMETWQEAALVADVGNRAQVPVISLAGPPITPPLLQRRWPSLIRVASDGAAQMKCIADLVSSYTWKRVVVIYEDDGYGSDVGMLLALLSDALHDIGSKIEKRLVLPKVSSMFNPSWDELEAMLTLPTFQSRVFIVLQSSLPTVTNLYRAAKKMGLVGKDSAWIITESVTSLLDPQVMSQEMKGTLGIKAYYENDTSSHANFKKVFQKKCPGEICSYHVGPGKYALQAYDLTRVVAHAIQTTSNSTSTYLKASIETILINYTGLSGDLHLKGGEVLYSPTFRIINIVEGNRYNELNIWRPEFGFQTSLSIEKNTNISNIGGSVVWPGNLIEASPKGWAMPTATKPIIIGVPGKTSFGAFVKIQSTKNSAEKIVDGFCVQVFNKIRERLKYTLHYEFRVFNGSYDDLVEKVHNKVFDAGVGDFTLLADRLDKVEFAETYIGSGLSVIVPEEAEHFAWTFLKPLTWQMWAATGGVFVYTIFIIWFLERQTNPEFSGPLINQIGTATWFAFTSLFFSHREKICNNLTRVVVVVWLFVVLIITSSYTANLSSMLTIQQLKPNITDVETLLRTNSKVGMDGDTFVMNYLENVIGFKGENIIKVASEYNYTEEFRNKRISAAFLEHPYAKVFMNKYCKGYTVYKQTYNLGGQGFIFQKGSPIARDFTKAILELLEDGQLKLVEDAWLTPNQCPNNATSGGPESLRVQNFMGVYVISGVTSTICLLSSLNILLKKFQRQVDDVDASVWNRAVRIAKFIYYSENNYPARGPSLCNAMEMTSSNTGEHHSQAPISVQTEGSSRTT